MRNRDLGNGTSAHKLQVAALRCQDADEPLAAAAPKLLRRTLAMSCGARPVPRGLERDALLRVDAHVDRLADRGAQRGMGAGLHRAAADAYLEIHRLAEEDLL